MAECAARNPDSCIVASLLAMLPRAGVGCVERALTVATEYHNCQGAEELASVPGVLLGGNKDFEPALLTTASSDRHRHLLPFFA
jgi:hypothetical protein